MAKSIPITQIRKKLSYIDIPKEIKELLDISEINLVRDLASYSQTELVNLFKKDFDKQEYLDQLPRLALPVLSTMGTIYNKLKQTPVDVRLIAKLRTAVLSLKLDRIGTLNQAAIVYFLARAVQTKIESNLKLSSTLRETLSRICDELIAKLIRLIKNSKNLSSQEAFQLLQTKVSKLIGPKEEAFQTMDYKQFAETIYGEGLVQPMFGGNTSLIELQTAQMQEVEELVNEQLSKQNKFRTQAELTLSEYLSDLNLVALPMNAKDPARFISLIKLITILKNNSYKELLIDREFCNEIFDGLNYYMNRNYSPAAIIEDFLDDETVDNLQDFIAREVDEIDENSSELQTMCNLANKLKDNQTEIKISIKANNENRQALSKANSKKLAYLASPAHVKELQIPILAVKYMDEDATLLDILALYGPTRLDLETAIAFAATKVTKESGSDKVTMVINDLADPELLNALSDNRLIKTIDRNHSQKLLVTFSDSDDDSKVEDSYLPFDTEAPKNSSPIISPNTNSKRDSKTIRSKSLNTVS